MSYPGQGYQNQQQGQQGYGPQQGQGYQQGGQGHGPAQPGYGPGPGYGQQQGYQGQPQGQGYGPGPGYGATPAQQQPKGTLGAFFSQPAASGASLGKFFTNPGQSIEGIVARPLTHADVRPQTNMQTGQVQYYKDGSVKWHMIVPLLVQQSQQFPEGKAAWYVKGQAKDELARAMSEAGVPPDEDGNLVPEDHAWIRITFTGYRQVPNMNAAKQYEVIYRRPQGVARGQHPVANGQQYVQHTPEFAAQVAQAGQDLAGGPAGQYQQGPVQGGYGQQVQQGPLNPHQYAGPATEGYAQQGPPQDQGQQNWQPQATGFNGQPLGQQGPSQQVAAATQAGVQAAQQYQGQPSYQQPADQGQVPTGQNFQGQAQMSPERQALLNRLTTNPGQPPQQ